MHRFNLAQDKYPLIFQEFLETVIRESIQKADSNGGKYIASWVVNKATPTERQQFEWKGSALVQDAIHDAGRAIGNWQDEAIDPLVGYWGISADVDFEDIKRNFFIESSDRRVIEVNSMIIPSTLDQGREIFPFLPTDCIHTFDNGAKKSPEFGNQYVTQATIYDTGNPVKITDNVRFFPCNDSDFENFGTLTITIMPVQIDGESSLQMQMFIIFSHGRLSQGRRIEQRGEIYAGMEGFMCFSHTGDVRGGLSVSYFNENTLDANIGPVSKDEYLKNAAGIFTPLRSSTYPTVIMPKYFTEIIKFIADRNQCIMSGFFSNQNHSDRRMDEFYGGEPARKLMLVSGDRYSLDEIFRFMRENDVHIPFTYFGASRYERHFVKQDSGEFHIVSTPSRCLFSVRQKNTTLENPLMRKIRLSRNLLEEYNKQSANLEIEIKEKNIMIESIRVKSAKKTETSGVHYDRAEESLARIEDAVNIMDRIKEKIRQHAIEELSLSYQTWVEHEVHENVIENNERQLADLRAKLDAIEGVIGEINNDLVRTTELLQLNGLNQEFTSICYDSRGRAFNNTTRIIEIVTDAGTVENRLQDVESGYIYEPGQEIMTEDESHQRQLQLENQEQFGRDQHTRPGENATGKKRGRGGMKRTVKNPKNPNNPKKLRFNNSRKNMDGWMDFDFFKKNKKPTSIILIKRPRKTRKIKTLMSRRPLLGKM